MICIPALLSQEEARHSVLKPAKLGCVRQSVARGSAHSSRNGDAIQRSWRRGPTAQPHLRDRKFSTPLRKIRCLGQAEAPPAPQRALSCHNPSPDAESPRPHMLARRRDSISNKLEDPPWATALPLHRVFNSETRPPPLDLALPRRGLLASAPYPTLGASARAARRILNSPGGGTADRRCAGQRRRWTARSNASRPGHPGGLRPRTTAAVPFTPHPANDDKIFRPVSAPTRGPCRHNARGEVDPAAWQALSDACQSTDLAGFQENTARRHARAG